MNPTKLSNDLVEDIDILFEDTDYCREASENEVNLYIFLVKVGGAYSYSNASMFEELVNRVEEEMSKLWFGRNVHGKKHKNQFSRNFIRKCLYLPLFYDGQFRDNDFTWSMRSTLEKRTMKYIDRKMKKMDLFKQYDFLERKADAVRLVHRKLYDKIYRMKKKVHKKIKDPKNLTKRGVKYWLKRDQTELFEYILL